MTETDKDLELWLNADADQVFPSRRLGMSEANKDLALLFLNDPSGKRRYLRVGEYATLTSWREVCEYSEMVTDYLVLRVGTIAFFCAQRSLDFEDCVNPEIMNNGPPEQWDWIEPIDADRAAHLIIERGGEIPADLETLVYGSPLANGCSPNDVNCPWNAAELSKEGPLVESLLRFLWNRKQADRETLATAVWTKRTNSGKSLTDDAIKSAVYKANQFLERNSSRLSISFNSGPGVVTLTET